MKNVLHLVCLFVFLAVMMYAQSANDLGLTAGSQQIVAPSILKSAREGNRIYLLSGKEGHPSGNRPVGYGFFLSGKGESALSRTFIELREPSGDRLVRTISLGEVLGNVSDKWKALSDESSKSPEMVVSAYSFTSLGRHLKFYRTVQFTPDEHLPGGKGLSMVFSMASDKPLELVMRLMGECDGAFRSEGHAFVLGNASDEKASATMMILNATGAVSITGEAKQKKGDLQRFVIKSFPAKLTPDGKTVVLALVVAGTTIGRGEHAQKQAQNLLTYFNTQSAKPDMVAITEADRQSTNPGDTVGYAVVYHNIGTAPAKDVTISNPVPAGTQYIENALEQDGGVVDLERSQHNVVTGIRWKFEAPILPGESRSMRFRVLVR